MSTQPPLFEDPTLKSAIRAATDRHHASAALKARVAATLAGGGGAVGSARRPLTGAKRWLAMAATIVIGVGVIIGGYEAYLASPLAMDAASDNSVAAPTIWQSMVAVQDGGCHTGAEPMKAPLTDIKAIATEASTKLKRHVPIPDFTAQGWKLEAASYCTLAGYEGVRFHFLNAARSITVVSLPRAAYGYQYPGGDAYETTVEEHPIAGYLTADGLHCVVGERGMSLSDVKPFVAQLRAQ